MIFGAVIQGDENATIRISPGSLDKIKMLLMMGCYIRSWDSYLNKC